MIILSLNPLTEQQIQQVKEILTKSNCPNESLKNTFERYSGLIDGKIFFDDAQILWQEVSTKFAGKSFKDIISEVDACRQFIITVI